MKTVPLTDVIETAYERAKSEMSQGILPVENVQDLCHVAYIYAFTDLYQGSKKPKYKKHYSKPIDKLYKLFDKNTISENNSYASFAFCYLKVFEIEGIIKKSTFLAQFNHEKSKHA